MVIYSDTQHHQGIDLEGNDINKAKFPRIERDGLFVDEVRSNPTTGLLEIWDGTQWLGYIENDALPSGTVNQTLRHDGTGWVVNSTLVIYDHDGVKIIGDGYWSALLVESSSTDYANPNVMELKLPNDCLDSATFITAQPFINGWSPFSVYKNGKILSSYLRGTGNSLLEATADGTIQRSTQTIPATQLQSDWNQEDNTKVDFIKNKPEIMQPDWNQTDDTQPDYIWNKPTITLDGATQLQSDWNQTDDTKVDYIKGKPVIPQGLPSGNANNFLNYVNGAWVSTSRITNVENDTGSAFAISSPNVSQIASRAGTSSSYINLKHNDNGVHIYSYVSGSEQIFRISPRSTAIGKIRIDAFVAGETKGCGNPCSIVSLTTRIMNG